MNVVHFSTGEEIASRLKGPRRRARSDRLHYRSAATLRSLWWQRAAFKCGIYPGSASSGMTAYSEIRLAGALEVLGSPRPIDVAGLTSASITSLSRGSRSSSCATADASRSISKPRATSVIWPVIPPELALAGRSYMRVEIRDGGPRRFTCVRAEDNVIDFEAVTEGNHKRAAVAQFARAYET